MVFILVIGFIFSINHIVKMLEYNSRDIIFLSDFTLNNKTDDFSMRYLNNNDPKEYYLKTTIPIQEFKRLESNFYKLILWQISCESYKVYFNGELVDFAGDIENQNSYIWTSVNQINIPKSLLEESNELLIQLNSEYKVGKSMFPIIITTSELGTKMYNTINGIFINGYRIMVGILLLSSIFSVFVFLISNEFDIYSLYLPLSGVFSSIYMLNFTVINRLPFSLLTFKKIVYLCLYISIYLNVTFTS